MGVNYGLLFSAWGVAGIVGPVIAGRVFDATESYELAFYLAAGLSAHACVSSRPVYRFLDWLARLPDPNRPVQAIALIGAYALITGYLNWALSVVASALFVPFIARRNPKADIRMVIAAAYLGICTVWHGGLSGSAPLILATPGNPLLAPASGEPVIDHVLPVTETLFIPFNLVFIAILGAVALATVMLLHPRQNAQTLTSEQIDRMMPTLPEEQAPASPAARMEASRAWIVLAAILIGYPLGYSMVTRGFGATWTINAYNAVFLVAALLLQGRPSNLVRAFGNGARTASGVILQFPFYAGIFGVINNTGLGAWLGDLFVAFATTDTYPLVVYILFRLREPLRAVRRIRVADRGALPAAGREGARRIRHHDGARLRLRRCDDQLHPAVLGDTDLPAGRSARIRSSEPRRP